MAFFWEGGEPADAESSVGRKGCEILPSPTSDDDDDDDFTSCYADDSLEGFLKAEKIAHSAWRCPMMIIAYFEGDGKNTLPRVTVNATPQRMRRAAGQGRANFQAIGRAPAWYSMIVTGSRTDERG